MAYSFKKYWPDCEFPIYIVTNYKEEEIEGVNFIKVGDDKRCWCTLFLKGLEQIDADYIIFFQEDYWLGKEVNNDAIKEHLRYFEEKGLDFLKLQYDKMPRDNHRIGNTDYCVNKPNIKYSVNTAIAIWRVSKVREVLVDGWTGWKWEHNVISHIRKNHIQLNSEQLYSKVLDEKGITPIEEDAVVKGKWTPAAIQFLKENGFEDVIPKRQEMKAAYVKIASFSPKNRILRQPYWAFLKLLRFLKLN